MSGKAMKQRGFDPGNAGSASAAFVRTIVILAVLLLIAIVLSKGVFVLPSNLANIVRQNAMLLFITLAQFLVLLTGGIDLSAGATVAFSSVIMVLFQGYSIGGALVLVLLLGCTTGLVNGFIISYLNLPAFVITLGMQQIVYSAAKVMTNGAKIEHSLNGAELLPALAGFYKAEIFRIIIPIWLCVLVVILIALYMRTKYGYSLYAVGGNVKTAFFSGMPVKLVSIAAYCLSGALCAFAGFLFVSRVGTGDPDTGTLLALDSIAACSIGGVSLAGGKGTVSGAVMGLVALCVLNNVMSLVHVSPNVQPLVKGIVILLAVFMNSTQNKTGK
ncbi:MAG: ABC transporter permease [Treponema sp.]|jgi:ribose transport system permease protein|nr:ABC transporter permease [Treponema sp.]